MADAITVTIGGETIALPPILNFTVLERAWPAMTAMDEAGADPIRRTSARIAFIAAVLLETRPDLTAPVIKQRLRVNLFDGSDETTGLVLPVHNLLVASGLSKPGEVVPPETPAEETNLPTSNTLSPN